ncbi:2Fe-2S iron-sulfur cluster-binding protein [Lentzea cavernae]|uniref:Peptide ABC transporter substrate-binding protein n=1 Tax=Lentzea cavernae TaxID=2020703 RepID=A0ABQ3MNZ9_9PSEU|nr:2Fe-2S iron-sulfur cluster-binding protein [Lentzea cavernae]GHH52499.1 peptide ABC transporter substrate-binding protein [Lentzea cavernae]
MAKITYIQTDGTSTIVDVKDGDSVMRGAKLNGVPGIVAECGGGASCGTCHVYVDKDNTRPLSTMHAVEDELLYCTASPRLDNSRLSCQIPVSDDVDGLVVHVPEKQI